MNEHRLPDRMINYWNVLRKEAPLPDFNHFNASTIADIWQNCILFTVAPPVGGKASVLSFYQVGDNVRNIYGGDMIGRSFTTAHSHFQGAAIARRMEETLGNPVPLMDSGQFVNDRSKVVKYRSCLLPFGRDGTVTHIIVGLSWKEF